MDRQTKREASFSLPSILALVVALGSFFGGALWQFFLALGAIVLGTIGVAASVSPAKRGGLISLASIGIGLIAIVIALIRGLLWIIF